MLCKFTSFGLNKHVRCAWLGGLKRDKTKMKKVSIEAFDDNVEIQIHATPICRVNDPEKVFFSAIKMSKSVGKTTNLNENSDSNEDVKRCSNDLIFLNGCFFQAS